MTIGASILANAFTYMALRHHQDKKPFLQKSEWTISYAYYQTNLRKLADFVKENTIFYQAAMNREKNCRGLVILEAYFGLDEHIYQVDAGLIKFKETTCVQDYYE